MIKRIELVNFMSHPHTVILPAEGLTVLTGENNTGKSAVIAALQILARNVSGDFMMRHGERECRIIAETGEGHVLEWKRKNQTVSYTLNGRDIHRLRGSVPDDLQGLLRMPQVEAEGGPFDVHFGEQKKPIFLLDESPARRATFFASASDTIKLIEMQSLHRQKVRDAKTEEKRLAKEKSRLNRRLETLAPLERLDERLQHLEQTYAAIQAADSRIEGLSRLFREIEQTNNRVDEWTDTQSAAQSLSAPPALEATEALERTIGRFQNLASLAQKTEEDSDRLAGLAMPPDLSDTRPLSDIIARMNEAEMRQRRYQKHAAMLTQIFAPPEIHPLEALSSLISRLSNAENDVFRKKQRVKLLGGLTEPPASADTKNLERLIARIEEGQQNVTRRLAEANQIGHEASNIEAELRRFIEQTRICPTCGQRMDPEQFMIQAFHTESGKP